MQKRVIEQQINALSSPMTVVSMRVVQPIFFLFCPHQMNIGYKTLLFNFSNACYPAKTCSSVIHQTKPISDTPLAMRGGVSPRVSVLARGKTNDSSGMSGLSLTAALPSSSQLPASSPTRSLFRSDPIMRGLALPAASTENLQRAATPGASACVQAGAGLFKVPVHIFHTGYRRISSEPSS